MIYQDLAQTCLQYGSKEAWPSDGSFLCLSHETALHISSIIRSCAPAQFLGSEPALLWVQCHCYPQGCVCVCVRFMVWKVKQIVRVKLVSAASQSFTHLKVCAVLRVQDLTRKVWNWSLTCSSMTPWLCWAAMLRLTPRALHMFVSHCANWNPGNRWPCSG